MKNFGSKTSPDPSSEDSSGSSAGFLTNTEMKISLTPEKTPTPTKRRKKVNQHPGTPGRHRTG